MIVYHEFPLHIKAPVPYHKKRLIRCLIYQMDLPKQSFQVNGKDYDVPCVFQIWEKRETNRAVKEILYPTYYLFVKKDANPDLSIRRVGVYAGFISKDIVDKS